MSVDSAVLNQIRQDVESNPILLYMKGTQDAPMCGFSAQVVKVLQSYGVPFKTVNVLDDWNIREGIKEFASWPTIPQLYVKGKFVGGCDITMEMHRKGELAGIVKAAVS